MLKQALNWIIKSSANPDKVSLTLKAAIPTIVSIGLLLGVNLPADSLLELGLGLTALISALTMIFGAGRKIILSIRKK